MRAHRNPRIFPMTLAEFTVSAVGTCLAIYAIGAVMGVPWLG